MVKHLRLVRATDRVAHQATKRLPIEWLTYDEMVEKIVDRLNCSSEQAKEIVRCLYVSRGLVRPYQTWVKIEGFSFPADQFEDWLSRHHPNPRTRVAPSKRRTAKEISDAVTAYRVSTPETSIRGLEVFARECGFVGHRDQLRAEYKKQTGRNRAGRPRKNVP
jgi:hypothetical protein